LIKFNLSIFIKGMTMKNFQQQRLNDNAGIAIGPILFVVAILAILATAIAAGSSTFATNASQETNRTNAGSMIQIGQNLKLGVDRIVSLGTPLANVDINAQNTSTNTSIFSPLGGGLVPPSTALASTPATDLWYYTWGAVANLGSTSLERLAVLKVNQGVCDQINTMGANTTTPAGVDVGAFSNTVNLTAWPAALPGKMTGCLNNTNVTIPGYYFYQVLGVQ
jgi:type II secretory pathway pseudopilin PulG